MATLADSIRKNEELLRGAFKENEYRKVVLPFANLHRPSICRLKKPKRLGL